MTGNQENETETKTSKCGCLSKVSSFITNSLEGFFHWLGVKVGRHPWKTIFIVVFLSGACCVGMLKFEQENQGDKLWTPQDSLAKKHQNWVSEKFPSRVLFSTVMLTASDVLTPAVFKQLLEIDTQMKNAKNGTVSAWDKRCFKNGPSCFVSNLLEIWSFNATVIKSLTINEILQKINEPDLRSPVTQRKIDISQLLGEVTRSSSNNKITAAGAIKATYGMKRDEEGEEDTNNWEKEVSKILDDWSSSVVTVYYFTQYSFRDAAGSAIQGDVVLLSTGYLLIIIYVSLMLGNLTRLRIKIWLAILGAVGVGMAIGVSFGLSSAFGEMYGPVHSTLPFLLLGIGVDDMFVIVQAWSNLSLDKHRNLALEERVGQALKHAGCSITITSLTDFMAFMIGATTVLPALKSFCVFAGLGILADFIIQCTFFTACLALDAKRQESMRDSCCCCIKLSPDYTESNCGRKDRLQEFFGQVYAKVVLSLPGKIVVMVITGTLFGFNLYGTLMLRQYFDQIWFFPPDSMAYKYTIENNRYFPGDGESAAIYTGKINYFEDQGWLHNVHKVVAADEYVVGTSMVSWYDEYINWAKKNKPAAAFDANSEIKNETLFYSWLSQYLSGPAGRTFVNDVVFMNTTKGRRISSTRINFKHKDMDSTQTEVKAMEQLRDKIKKFYSDEMLVFNYGRRYISWETNKIIMEELFRNVGLALAVVFVVTLVVIANLWTSLMVLFCVAFTLVNLCGLMHFWGLTIDTVTTVLIVLAVGLAVDYASHIGHTFMVTAGTKQERAFITLRDMGPAVWNGGFSTFLAFILLAVSNSYVFTAFFKVFFGVVLFGMFHGLCFFPVLLSAIGPAPYDSALRHHDQHKKNLSRSHSPVHPISSAEDNRGFEMNDKPKSAGQKSMNGNANGQAEYNIPPPDYQGVSVEDIVRASSGKKA